MLQVNDNQVLEPQKDIDIIEYLRVFASLAVMWFHFTNGNAAFLLPGALEQSGAYGWLGVEIFFVISGFIIPYSMWRSHFKLKTHWLTFFKKRVARLYPAYLLAIALIVFLWYLSTLTPGFKGEAPQIFAADLISHLLFLNSLLGKEWLNPAFWTLAIEVQYYLLIVLIYASVSAPKILIRLIPYFLLCCAAFAFRGNAAIFFHWSPLYCMGILTFQRFVLNIGLLEYVLILGLLYALTWLKLGWLIAVVGIVTALVITFAKIPKSSFITYLASISYSLYLIHSPIGGRVINLSLRLADNLLVKIFALALASALSILTATLIYQFVEKPAQKWSQKILLSAKS
jgi:peptidoglycan/LPS O-acetylase OafA/YrhL